jgi:cobalt-zinc-cadmium efflux system membrane fusion protein
MTTLTKIARSAAALALLALPLAALAGCRKPVSVQPESPAASDSDVVVVSAQALRDGLVVARTPEVAERAPVFQAPAVLALDERVTARVGSLTEGVVVSVGADVGTRIKPGDALARVHSHIVHDAWAAFRTADAERRRREAEAGLARQNEARAERLLAAKAIAPQELAGTRVDRVAADEALDMAGAELQRAKEDLHLLGLADGGPVGAARSEYVSIRSPFAGVLLERLVTPGTAVTPGTPMFVISDVTRLWAIAEIDEVHLRALTVGRTADLSVAAYPGESVPVVISFIGQAVNPATRRVTVRCEVGNRAGRLKPQMYASVRIPLGSPREVLVIPADAVQELDGERVVFVEVGAGRFARRTVATGEEEAGALEIRRGLQRSDRVVVKGAFLVKSRASQTAAPEN